MRQLNQPWRWKMWVWSLLVCLPLLWSQQSLAAWQVLPEPVQKVSAIAASISRSVWIMA